MGTLFLEVIPPEASLGVTAALLGSWGRNTSLPGPFPGAGGEAQRWLLSQHLLVAPLSVHMPSMGEARRSKVWLGRASWLGEVPGTGAANLRSDSRLLDIGSFVHSFIRSAVVS